MIVTAQEEVRELGSGVAGTEHLLLALCRVDALVGDFLHGLGVTHERLRREVPTGQGAGEVVPLGPDFKAALEAAVEHADRMGRTGVGPEHLLLGALAAGGVAAGCLHELGISAAEVSETLLSMALPDPGLEEVAPLFPIAPRWPSWRATCSTRSPPSPAARPAARWPPTPCATSGCRSTSRSRSTWCTAGGAATC